MKFVEFIDKMYYGTQFDIQILDMITNEHKILKDVTPHILRSIEYREYYNYEVLRYGTRWADDERDKLIFEVAITNKLTLKGVNTNGN